MANVDEAVRRLRIEYTIDGAEQTAASLSKVEQAYARVQAQQKQYAAANDNLRQNIKAANDNYEQFGRTIVDTASGILETASHLKLLAVGAYALSPAFRSFTNSGVAVVMGQLGANAGVFASAMARVVSFLSPALAFFTRLAVPITALVVVWKTLNAIIDTGSSLLEKYGGAGRALFGPDVDKNLEKLTKFQQDTISLKQVQYATELGVRLDKAKQTISDFFKIQFDLTAPALALQAAWVGIVEAIAKAVDYASRLPSKLPQIGDTDLSIAATGVPPISVGDAQSGGKGNFDTNSTFRALQLARARLAAGLGGGFAGRFTNAINDLANPPKPEEAQGPNAYDRAVAQIEKQIDLLRLEAEGVGRTSREYQELKAAHELNIAAMKAGIPVTEEMRQKWKEYGDQIADLIIKQNQLRVLQQEQFRGATQFMSPADQAAAQAAHQIDPTNWQAHLNDAGPRLAYINQQLRTGADLAFNFFDSFNQGLQQGKSATEALQSSLRGLESQLIQMATRQAINMLFSKLFNLFGGGDLSGAGNAGWNAPLSSGTFVSANGSVFDGGNLVPFARGGIVSRPTLFPFANGTGLMGEAGPEAIMPLQRDASGRLGVSGGGVQVNVNVINQNGSDVSVSQQRNPLGGVDLQVMVRDVTNENIAGGYHDSAMRRKFGARPPKVT